MLVLIKKYSKAFLYVTLCLCMFQAKAQSKIENTRNESNFKPGELWKDDQGKHINAHGSGMLFHNGTYYWFGEHKGEKSNNAYVGVTCYSSKDLYNWKNESVALAVENTPESLIYKGCIIERPKVIYNQLTKKFVMYFHLELFKSGYDAAYTGVAVSEKITGPYKFLHASRVNAGYWPLNMPQEHRRLKLKVEDYGKWWTPKWREGVAQGLFVRENFYSGQMSRDMTLFTDEDGKAYQIYSSEENLTLQIAELSDDYTKHTGKYIRVEPGGHNEAPTIFKRKGRYFMITSGCTGWDPNAARLLVADHILGEWKLYPNPCLGPLSELTFRSQGTFIFPVQGKKDAFIFMADRWRSSNPIDGRYIWLPIRFENNFPIIKWMDQWDLSVFN